MRRRDWLRAGLGALTLGWGSRAVGHHMANHPIVVPGAKKKRTTCTVTAGSLSSAAVQAAIDACPNGGRVCLPAGAGTWTTPLTLGRGIHLRGASAPGPTITYGIPGSTDTLVNMQEYAVGHTELSRIQFVNGEGDTTISGGYVLAMTHVADGLPMFIHDVSFTGRKPGSMSGLSRITCDTNRGVIWNCTSDFGPWAGSTFSRGFLHQKATGLTTSWTTADTMGDADLEGTSNLYVEDCTFIHHTTETFDADDNSRLVVRHNTFDQSGMSSHGHDTSPYGTRHWELYDNEFIFTNFGDNDGSLTANVNYWFFIRGGTGVIVDNIMPNITSTAWGNKSEIIMTVMNLRRGVGPCYSGSYPYDHQVGQGHDGATLITDPVYIWGNTGLPGANPALQDFSCADPQACDTCATAQSTLDYVIADRDYVLGTAKPGYTKFAYPHPLRAMAT